MEFAEKWELAQERYQGTIRTFARNCVRQIPTYDLIDIEQELLVVLWECVIKYDPNRGATFNTLFQGCAKNRCISLIRFFQTKKRTAVVSSLDEDSVRLVVDSLLSEFSSEDYAMARFSVADEITARSA